MKIIKTSILISSFILLPLYGYANNFYIGMGGGYESAVFNKKLVIDGVDPTYHYDKNDKTGSDGFFGTIFTGYAWTYDPYYLALEANANLSSLKYNGWYKEPGDTSFADFTLYENYGISVVPGYEFFDNRLLVYARVGFTKGNFGYKEYKTSEESSIPYGVDDRQWLNGIRYGLGVEANLKNNWSWRLEFNHINYQTYTDTSFPLPKARLRKIDLTPETNQIELALIYRF